ncbi:hypothetical protein C1645_807722 [Glomus cerebriforme]|uniref:Uncharacterized protein n=1 Tax=Glomus cerebriforme TaxID=658196 RepID=A0A397SK79_9GLOM|nr:hypothetical protein C1645_807722 [Glomus cerebriforme]
MSMQPPKRLGYHVRLVTGFRSPVGFMNQAQTEEVKTFWRNIDLEKEEMEIRISSMGVLETDNSTYSDESSSIPLTDTSSQQSAATPLAEVQITKVPKPKKYIDRDIASEVLKMYQTSVLPDMKKMKKTEVAKSPLNIRVINFHNLDCTRYLPHSYNNYIADQLQDQNSEAVNFANGKKIDKFIVDCDEQVLNYLDKFYEVDDLETLGGV